MIVDADIVFFACLFFQYNFLLPLVKKYSSYVVFVVVYLCVVVVYQGNRTPSTISPVMRSAQKCDILPGNYGVGELLSGEVKEKASALVTQVNAAI